MAAETFSAAIALACRAVKAVMSIAGSARDDLI